MRHCASRMGKMLRCKLKTIHDFGYKHVDEECVTLVYFQQTNRKKGWNKINCDDFICMFRILYVWGPCGYYKCYLSPISFNLPHICSVRLFTDNPYVRACMLCNNHYNLKYVKQKLNAKLLLLCTMMSSDTFSLHSLVADIVICIL